jgi:hypothetical protein
VTFRDDHDATLARAEALEHDLDRTRDKLEDTTDRLAEAEGERARLAEEVRRLRAQTKGSNEPEPEPVPTAPRQVAIEEPIEAPVRLAPYRPSAQSPLALFGIAFLVFLGLAGVVVLAIMVAAQ